MRPFRLLVLVLSWLLLWSVGSAAPAQEGFSHGDLERRGPPLDAPAALVAELNVDADTDAPTGDPLAAEGAGRLTIPAPIARETRVVLPTRRLFDRRAATLVGVVVILD